MVQKYTKVLQIILASKTILLCLVWAKQITFVIHYVWADGRKGQMKTWDNTMVKWVIFLTVAPDPGVTELHPSQETMLKCTHGLVNTCHYSYVTKYRNSHEEKCSGRLSLMWAIYQLPTSRFISSFINLKRSFKNQISIYLFSITTTPLPLLS